MLLLKEVSFMNNKGQSLVLFVLILPLIVGFIAYFIDTAYVNYQKSHVLNIVESNLMIILDKEIRDKSEIEDVFKKNDIVCKSISIDEEMITISVDISFKSIFGKILNNSYYRVKTQYVGNYVDKKITKEWG